jgi:hypothetical protein
MDETPEDLYRAKWTQASREAYHKEHPENFAGDGMDYPIKDGNDVKDAWNLAGHGDNPNKIRSRIKSIAKRLGLTSHLPDTAKDSKKASRAMTTDNDAFLYVPITRIDKNTWEVEGQATSDVVDYYDTTFDYDSSKRAFQTWRGNIREMHQDKAVGRAIEVKPDDETRTIAVRAFVSKGARDTWEKVLDGTLSGFSIGVPKGKYKSRMVERNGRTIKEYYDHELAELSLVDNPGSPGCNIAVVRADGVATEVLDDTEVQEPGTQTPDLKRAGATISHATQNQLHDLRDGHLSGVAKALAICMCEECMALCAILDPDQDGDIDLVDSLDLDGDDGQQDMMGSGVPAYALEAAITRHMAPMITRVNAVLSSYAQRSYPQPQELSTEPLERRIADVERAFDTKLTEVRSVLTEVKELATKIAAMPMPGGPVMTPVDKRLATSPQQGFNPNDDVAAIQRAATLGLFKDQDSQVAAAAQLFRLQHPDR